MSTLDLVEMARAMQLAHAATGYLAVVTAVDTTACTVAIDTFGGGDSIDDVGYIGGPPVVGQTVLYLVFDRFGVVLGGEAYLSTTIADLLAAGVKVTAGSIYIGDPANATQRLFAVDKLDGADAYESTFQVMTGGATALRVVKNGTEVNRLRINPDGSAGIGATGGPVRPIPYAQAAGAAVVTMNGTAGNTLAVTFPSGRFLVPPIVVATPSDSAVICSCRASDVTAAGFNLAISSKLNANLTNGAQYTGFWMATQMTPTASTG